MADQNDFECSNTVRDDEYYFQQAIFLVEDRLFKVPVSHFVEESDVFRAMFELPQDPMSTVDGLTDKQPRVLEGVKKEHFKQLLRVLYRRSHRDEEKLTLEQWTDVLALSSKWDMDRVRRLAISKITPTLISDPHKLVLLGQQFNVDSWLFSGIQGLVDRQNPMNGEDAEILGNSIVHKVSTIRESLQEKAANKYKAFGGNWQAEPIRKALKKDVRERISVSFSLNLEVEG